MSRKITIDFGDLGKSKSLLLTVNETAALLNIQPGTIRKWISINGKGCPVKPVRVGRAVRFPLIQVLEYIGHFNIDDEPTVRPETPRHDEIPMAFSTVQAGFPSPADDYSEGHLDIHKHLVKRPASTVFFKPDDDSMSDFGMYQGDIVLVDLSLKPMTGKIVLVQMCGERVLRRFSKSRGRVILDAGRGSYPQDITDGTDIEIMGVATFVIHEV